MPLKIICTADLHLGQSGPIQQSPIEIQEERINDSFRNLDFIASYAIERKVDFLVICGDVFHTPRPNAQIFNRFARMIGNLSEKGVQTVVVAGNHDLPRLAGGETYLSALREVRAPGFWFFDKPGDLVLEGKHSGRRVRFVAIPYLHLASPEEDKRGEEIKRIIDQMLPEGGENSTIVLSHLVCEGSYLGILKELVMHPEPVIPRSTLLRENVALVLLGHLHGYQVIDKRIIYPGSPERMSFSEEKEKKGFVEVYEEKGELRNRFVPTNPRPLLTYPMNDCIDLSESLSPTEDMLKAIEDIRVPEGAIVRLVYKSGRKQSIDWRRIVEYLRNKGAFFAISQPLKEQLEVPATAEPSLNLRDLLKEFIQKLKIPKEVAKLAIEEGIKIIDEVSEGL
jgi:exonuclease SbcD